MSRFSLSFGLFVALSLTACGGRPPPHPDDEPVLRQPVVAGDGATACTVGPATYALGARFEADAAAPWVHIRSDILTEGDPAAPVQ